MSRNSCTSNQFLGSWIITECQIHPADDSDFGKAKGIKFTLDTGGSVIWANKDNTNFPLTYCDTYEFHPSQFCDFICFAGFRGDIIEFRVERPSHQEMVLSIESCIILTCKLVSSQQSQLDFPFSLLPALEDGYFSDLELCTSDGYKIAVHETILSLSLPNEADRLILKGLPKAVLLPTLHYFYSHMLPPTLSASEAELCLEYFQGQPQLAGMVELCQSFLKNTNLRNQLQLLISGIHSSLDRMVLSLECGNKAQGHIKASSLWQSLKYCFRESILITVRFVHVCVTYMKQKNQLTPEERQEVLAYFLSRLPILATQVHNLLKCLKNFTVSLSPSQDSDLAAHIAPEVDDRLSIIWAITIECKNITEQIINSLRVQPPSGHLISDMLLRREIFKLKNVHEKLLLTVMFLSHKKDNFAEMSAAGQVRSVMRTINLVMEEIPLVILRLEDVMASLDESVSSTEFHFTFTIVASKISLIVDRLRELKGEPNVRALLHRLCDLMERDEFYQLLVSLELLPSPGDASLPFPIEASTAFTTSTVEATAVHSSELSSCRPVSCDPKASRSQLARRTLALLKSETNCDLEFVLPTECDGATRSTPGHIIRAHRVVVSARCCWFRQALLSGMREAIDRKIILPDCTPAVLTLTLRFLYGDDLSEEHLSNEQLIELLIVADRLQVEELSSGCQAILGSRLDCSNVLLMLSVADQWSAKHLKDSCLSYIWKNTESIDKEGINELPLHLRNETLIHTAHSESSKFLCPKWKHKSVDPIKGMQCSQSRNSSRSSSTSSSKESVDLLQELTNEMRITVAETEQEHREQRLEHCVLALADILVDVERHELLRLALAADCDVNRAVNYYLAQPDPNKVDSSHE